jgi:hypothetical protein
MLLLADFNTFPCAELEDFIILFILVLGSILKMITRYSLYDFINIADL